jgi:peptide/nickel transport system permease protein
VLIVFAVSLRYKRRLGLYGKLFDSYVGMVGFAIVMFWVFTAIFADWIITHDPLAQVRGMRNAVPGSPLADPTGAIPTTCSAATAWRATSSRAP